MNAVSASPASGRAILEPPISCRTAGEPFKRVLEVDGQVEEDGRDPVVGDAAAGLGADRYRHERAQVTFAGSLSRAMMRSRSRS